MEQVLLSGATLNISTSMFCLLLISCQYQYYKIHNAHGPNLDKPRFHPQINIFLYLLLVVTEIWLLCPIRVPMKESQKIN